MLEQILCQIRGGKKTKIKMANSMKFQLVKMGVAKILRHGLYFNRAAEEIMYFELQK